MSREPVASVYVVAANGPRRGDLRALFASVQLPTFSYPSLEALLGALTPGDRGCIVADAAVTGTDAAEFRARLRVIDSTLPIIYLSGSGTVSTAVEAIKAGATDFLQIPYNEQNLLDAVHEAVYLDRRDESERRHQRGLRQRFDALTPREWELLKPMCRGWSNHLLASHFGLSDKTVEAYRARIIRKTGSRNLPQLMRTCLRAGLLDEDGERRPAARGT